MEWFEELDFEANPFNPDVLNSNLQLIDRDKESKEILYRIISGSMLVIEGSQGFGKTSLLKYAIDNFRGKGKVVYIDAKKLSKRFNINRCIKKKGMILLLDNVQWLTKFNDERIKYLYDEDFIKAVIFATNDYKACEFSESLRERIGKNIIRLPEISETMAVQIATERLNGKDILPEKILKPLFKQSLNMKNFIANCNLLCEQVVKSGNDQATIEDIFKLKLYSDNEQGNNLCEECKTDLILVGEFYRCPNCDEYCEECGALIDDKDDSCPECERSIECKK